MCNGCVFTSQCPGLAEMTIRKSRLLELASRRVVVPSRGIRGQKGHLSGSGGRYDGHEKAVRDTVFGQSRWWPAPGPSPQFLTSAGVLTLNVEDCVMGKSSSQGP